MPRIARPVAPGVPHHVTQRGNRQERVFHSAADFAAYRESMGLYSRRHGVEVVAYCLMPNHVHLVLVPRDKHALDRMLRPTHTRHAQRINRTHGLRGHVWQGRYFSAALDEHHFYAAVRYVEVNPVRAGLVARAEDYPWSSAAAHCGLTHDDVLGGDRAWVNALAAVGNWASWLADGTDAASDERLREATRRCRPCGSEGFVRRLEEECGRPLALRRRGGQRKI